MARHGKGGWFGTRGVFKPEGFDSRSPEYGAWKNIRHRCDNPDNAWYHRYGGRGINVCERWRGFWGFAHFINDMGPRPTPQHSLDRIDNDGHYEPGNCRWATVEEQNANKTRSGKNGPTVVFEGKTLRGWADEIGVGYDAFKVRYRKFRAGKITREQLEEPPAAGRVRGVLNRKGQTPKRR